MTRLRCITSKMRNIIEQIIIESKVVQGKQAKHMRVRHGLLHIYGLKLVENVIQALMELYVTQV